VSCNKGVEDNSFDILIEGKPGGEKEERKEEEEEEEDEDDDEEDEDDDDDYYYSFWVLSVVLAREAVSPSLSLIAK